jgi:hypothetical protein
MLAGMAANGFLLVDAGGRCMRPGDAEEVALQDVFRVAAPGRAAAETVGRQLMYAEAGRRRRIVSEAWAKARDVPA